MSSLNFQKMLRISNSPEVNGAVAVFFGSRRKSSAFVQMRHLILPEVPGYQRPSVDLSGLSVYQMP